ncbi:DUF2642 domain-containing protein [Paenibacillus sp. 2TAB23]|uniref:DUF2642 domain-containing protein n=1 Tax=Paenibacillus sp. 2TAB23 TaxID=3233004 RepID=UPI003F99F403
MSYCCNYQNVAGQMDSNNNHRCHRSNGQNDDFLQSLVGKNVKINRGGPDSIQGKLLAVKSDYLVVNTREGVVYVARSHVKSITEVACDKNGGNKSGGNKSGGHKSGHRDPNFIKANNFRGVIRALNQTFVQINWGGPERVEGFLAQVNNNSVLLVSGKEAIQIQIDHIKTIKELNCGRSGGNNSTANNSDSNKNKNDNKNDNKNENKSNKSQGNRSGGKNRANAASVKMVSKAPRRSVK